MRASKACVDCGKVCTGTRCRACSNRHKAPLQKKVHRFSVDNPSWKGEKVGYFALHDYIKSILAKPSTCSRCGEEKRLDLANISGQYLRDVNDWQWLCRRCHMTVDGRLDNFKSVGRNKPGWEYRQMKYKKRSVQ